MPCSVSSKDYMEIFDCSIGNCRVDGVWSDWGRWTYCATLNGTSCGKGTRARSRACNNPMPENGGSLCQGWFSRINQYDSNTTPNTELFPEPEFNHTFLPSRSLKFARTVFWPQQIQQSSAAVSATEFR